MYANMHMTQINHTPSADAHLKLGFMSQKNDDILLLHSFLQTTSQFSVCVRRGSVIAWCHIYICMHV